MRKKRITALLLAAVMAFVFLTGFRDVPKSHWGYQDITNAVKAQILKGYGNDMFGPDDATTKEQLAIVLYRVLEQSGRLKSDQDHSGEYADVLKACRISDWAYKEVAYGLKYGLWDAEDFKEAKAFGGNTHVGREMITRWILNAAEYPVSALRVLSYTDVSRISPLSFRYVDALNRYKIMMGNADGSFGAGTDTTRAQMSAIAMRVLDNKFGAAKNLDRDLVIYRGVVSDFSVKDCMFNMNVDGKILKMQISDTAAIMFNGKKISFADLAAFGGRKLTVSTVAGEHDTVIIHDSVDSFAGKDAVVVKCEKRADYTAVNVVIDDVMIPFCITGNTAIYGGEIKVGSMIRLFSDGCELLEVKVL